MKRFKYLARKTCFRIGKYSRTFRLTYAKITGHTLWGIITWLRDHDFDTSRPIHIQPATPEEQKQIDDLEKLLDQFCRH